MPLLEALVVQLVNGLVSGMILALVASGLTLIFGIMDVVNFAHGELFMLGAYVGTTVLVATGSFWAALLVASTAVGLLGAVIQVVALRPLLSRDPLTTILATFGLSLVLQNYALWQYGPVARKIQEPITGHFRLFQLEYPWYRIVIAVLSASLIGLLWLFLQRRTGSWPRPWGSPCPGSTPGCSPSARPWRRRAGSSSAPSSESTTRWGSTSS